MATPSYRDLPVSPFVSKLLEAKQDGPVFVTRGYLGGGDEKVVRLYFDLSLETYAEIPRSAVLHADAVAGSAHQRAELIVDATKEVRVVSVLERTLKQADIQEAVDRAKAHETAPQSPDPCGTPSTTQDCHCRSGASPGPATATQPNTLEQLKQMAVENEQRKRVQEEDHESGPDPLRILGCVLAPWTCR